MAYEDFFTIYNLVQPPKGYYEEDIKEDIKNNIEDKIEYNIEDNIEEYPGVENPFENPFENSFSNNSYLETNTQVLKGSKQFEKAFLEALKIDPSIYEYKNFLVKTAKRESNFNSYIQNTTGAPYYGYFQMGKDEIKRTTGLTVEEFRNNPVLLILGAVKLYKMNLKTIKALKIYELGKLKGYSDDALVAGAWMGGPGGVKKYLLGKGDPSDSHWYGGKGGSSVGRIMNNWRENELKN